MSCTAFTNSGLPCKAAAKISKKILLEHNLCHSHFKSMKRHPITWETFQTKMKLLFLRTQSLTEADKKWRREMGLKQLRNAEKTSARISARFGDFARWAINIDHEAARDLGPEMESGSGVETLEFIDEDPQNETLYQQIEHEFNNLTINPMDYEEGFPPFTIATCGRL